MAVFRIEKTRDYTVMSNYHLRDMSLSLKAKGLLSLMLSLPENWDYTMKGLARICKDGIDSISGGIRELEEHGYLIRERVRGANGQLGSIEYTILEQPKAPSPTQEKPIRENPVQANPMLDAPIQENPAQLNKEESSNYPSKTDLSITEESSPILSSPPAPRERTGQDGMRKRESYRALILENIEYDVLSQNVQLDKDRLDELVELMVDMKYVIDSKTYEKHIRDEVHLYGLLHQLAFLAGKVKDEEDMANLVETSKHYGEIAEKKFDDWLIPGRYLAFGDRADLSELKAAELTPLTAVLKVHDAKIREKQHAAASNDPAYIISGSAFRMLVGDLFDLLAQYGYLRNRVLDVKTERQLARLQKNLSGDHPAIRRMYCRWGFAEDQGVTCYDILEAKLRRAHLTPYDPDGSEADYD